MSIKKNNNMLVKDLMLLPDQFPVVNDTVILKEALEKMNKFQLGIACIIDNNKKLIGVLTDGDIRRKLLIVQKPFSAFLVDDVLIHSIQSPVTVLSEDSLVFSIKIMGEKQIWDLPVTNNEGILVGLLHLHPVVKSLLNNNY